MSLQSALPSWARRPAEQAYYLWGVARRLGGKVARECPVCGYRGRFGAHGLPPRFDAKCPRCGSLERHRLLELAFAARDLVRAGDKLLHFAPEASLQPIVERRGVDYVSADLTPGRAQIVLNLEKVDLPDASVDVVLANHVLEHVDDRAALAELFRILRPGGRLIATVPLIEGWDVSYENPAPVSPADRDLHFGQWDHVRYYGRDFRDRVRAAGFRLEEYVGSGEDAVRYGLTRGERVFIGWKD